MRLERADSTVQGVTVAASAGRTVPRVGRGDAAWMPPANARLRHLHQATSRSAPQCNGDCALPVSSAAAARQLDVVIVGAGFAGMYAIRKFRDEMGLSVQVLEKGHEVGGTWYWNRYPGARCDVHSVEYSFSWDDELQQEWEWREVMAAQPEIHEYQRHVADRFDLRRSIQFDTTVTACTFDDATNLWTVSTAGGQRLTARFVVSCVGCLSTPKDPEIPGLDDFAGEVYHTGEWPHEEVDFSGKRVGIIGTGSSGIQSIPIIANECDHLTVFQRTPQYSLPANNHDVDEEYVTTMKKNYAKLRELGRYSPAGFITGFGGRTSATDGTHMPQPQMFKVLDKTEEERDALLEEHGFELFRRLADVGTSMEANQVACDLFAKHLRSVIDDPDTAAKLTPSGQPFGCKRQVMDTGYYATFNRENVDLVDLRRGAINRVTPAGISTEQGDFRFDTLVLATGYDAMTGALLGMNITGREGKPLTEHWAAGPRTYLGLQMAGFPNLFAVTGPGSPSVLSSMITSIEQHVEFVAGAIGHMIETGKEVMETTAEQEDEWVAHCNYASSFAVVQTHDSCNSWCTSLMRLLCCACTRCWLCDCCLSLRSVCAYLCVRMCLRHHRSCCWDSGSTDLGANVPGKPRIFMPYIGG